MITYCQEAWLVFCSNTNIKLPVTKYSDLSHNTAITKEMAEMKESKKFLYLVVYTYENSIKNPDEYFEELPLFPEWVEKVKLLFTWSVKNIMEEEDKVVQEAIIRGHFVRSKRYPDYLMNFATSQICDCDYRSKHRVDAISNNNTTPNCGCSLPMLKSPLQLKEENTYSRRWGGRWEDIFKFAWKALHSSGDTDSSFSSDTECSDSNKEDSDSQSDECDRSY